MEVGDIDVLAPLAKANKQRHCAHNGMREHSSSERTVSACMCVKTLSCRKEEA